MDKMKNIYIIILLLITVNLKSQINCCTGLGQAVFVKYGCSAKLQISGATKALFNLENTRISTVTSNYVTINDGVNTATLNLQNLSPTYTILSIQDSIIKWHNECLSQSLTCLDPCTLPLPVDVVNDSLLVHILNDSLDFEYKTYCYREKATGKRFDFNIIFNTKNASAPTFMNLVDVEQLNEVFKADYINNIFVGTFPNISADYVSCEMFIDSVYVANQFPSIENDYEAICYKVGAGSIKQGFKRFVNTGLTTNLIEILDSSNTVVVGAVQVPCNDTLCFEILDSTTYVKLVNYCDNGVNILKEYTYRANTIISSRFIDKNGVAFTVSGNEIIGECVVQNVYYMKYETSKEPVCVDNVQYYFNETVIVNQNTGMEEARDGHWYLGNNPIPKSLFPVLSNPSGTALVVYGFCNPEADSIPPFTFTQCGNVAIPSNYIGYDFDLPNDFGTTDANDTYLHIFSLSTQYFYPPATTSPTTPIVIAGNEGAINIFIQNSLIADGFVGDEIYLVVNADNTITVWHKPTYTPNGNEFWLGTSTPGNYTNKIFPTIPTTHTLPNTGDKALLVKSCEADYDISEVEVCVGSKTYIRKTILINGVENIYFYDSTGVVTAPTNYTIGKCDNSLSVSQVTPAYSSNRTLLTANTTPVAYNIPVPTNTREITIQNITGADISVATSQGSQIVGTRNSISISNPSNTTQLQSVFTGNVTISFLSSVLDDINGVAPRVIINFKSY